MHNYANFRGFIIWLSKSFEILDACCERILGKIGTKLYTHVMIRLIESPAKFNGREIYIYFTKQIQS